MAPSNLTLRSASISSSSTASSKSSCDAIKKKFGCSHPGCGKSFSRSEHLHRHALNHKDGNNTCMRCSAHFRRRDLLDRHMARHKEKDDEAGGEGLGVLATRKRLWRDVDGSIVNARRPSYTQEGSSKRRMTSRHQPERKGSFKEEKRLSTTCQPILSALPSPSIPMSRVGSTQSTIVVDTTRGYPDGEERFRSEQEEEEEGEEELDQDSWLDINNTALPSPLQSSSSSFSDSLPSGSQSPSAELDTLYEDTWPITSSGLPQIINNSPLLGRESEYPASPSWGGPAQHQSFQTFMGAIGDFEDMQPLKEEYGMGIYGWQNPWSSGSQMMLSKCREEKFDPFGERSSVYPGQEVLRRGFGMGTC